MANAVKRATEFHPTAFQWAVPTFCEYYNALASEGFWAVPRPAVHAGDEDISNTGPCDEFIVLGLAIVAQVLSESAYFDGSTSISAAMQGFWTPARLRALLVASVSHGMRMTPSELAEWEDDPEEYEVHQVWHTGVPILCFGPI